MTRAGSRAVAVAILAVVAGGCAGMRPARQPAHTPLPPLEEPYETPIQVEMSLIELEQTFLANGDERSVFATSYIIGTRVLREHIGVGFFEDDAFVTRTLVAFGNFYRRGLLAYERGDLDAVPPIWRVAHGVALQGRASRHEHLMLGIIAHLRDLGPSVVEAYGEPSDPGVRRRDFLRVNRILHEVSERTQRRLARLHSAAFDATDALGLFFDEGIGTQWLRGLREEAWRSAMRIRAARTEADRTKAIRRMDERSLWHARGARRLPDWMRGFGF